MTCLIQSEIARVDECRVRRIFPELSAMLAVVTVAAYIFFFPVDLVRYASLFAAPPGANFEFWREAGSARACRSIATGTILVPERPAR